MIRDLEKCIFLQLTLNFLYRRHQDSTAPKR